MPTFIPSLSVHDAEGATEEGGNCGMVLGALTVTSGSSPTESCASPAECKASHCRDGYVVLHVLVSFPFHGGMYVVLSSLRDSSAIMRFLSEGR